MNFKFLVLNFKANKAIFIVSFIALIFVLVFVFWWNKEIVVSKNSVNNPNGPKSSISGISCDRVGDRPIAVMLAGDKETIPLSGIGQADMVFEMPVTPNGITRFMAVFQCETPKEIGSVRSSRIDFIPLARGLKAIYAHWGGEHEALDELNKGIINNIDAMKYEGSVFYRKRGVPQPHDGFTSFDLLYKKSEELAYDLKDNFVDYPHKEKVDRNLSNLADSINVGYPDPFNATWIFDSATNVYKRNRNGQPEVNKNTNEQVSASVVVLMRTKITFWRDQYMRVNVTGQGVAQVFEGGIVINGKWKKDSEDSKLGFYDQDGKEIKFLPGKIWVEITSNI